MCDPIGAVTLAGSVLATCYSYGCAVADAPQEAQSLAAEISSLAGLLVGLQATLSSSSDQSKISNLAQSLADCQQALNLVSGRLARHNPAGQKGHWDLAKRRLLWPLRKSDTLGLIVVVERQKGALNAALGTFALEESFAQRQQLESMQDSIVGVSDQINAIQVQHDQAKVLKWLSKYDHTAQHHQATQAYCRNTCGWILEDTSFKGWLASTSSILWLSGHAGSGKTILTSFVISHLRKTQPRDTVVAYFYCNASTSQSLDLDTTLSSVLSQLCSSTIPPCVMQEYRQAGALSGVARSTSSDRLQYMLIESLKTLCTDTVFVIDSVDETEDTGILCNLLCSLVNTPGLRLRIFISARPCTRLNTQMSRAYRIVLTKNMLKNDIETYIKQRMSTDQRLSQLSDEVKSSISMTLLNRSDGMFRWVQCQMDEISRLRTDRTIIAALASLPKSLQETYQRALDRTLESDKTYLRRALLWLTWSLRPLKIAAVADAIVLESGITRLDRSDQLNDPEELLDICGIFASYSNTFRYNHEAHQMQLAHHSVRNFLESLGQESDFWMPARESHRELAELCLTFLLLEDWAELIARSPQTAAGTADNSLLHYAACAWPMHVLQSESEAELESLIAKIMTPIAGPTFHFWIQAVVLHEVKEKEFYEQYRPQPLYYAASYGLEKTVISLISKGADLNAKAGSKGGTALHAACFRRHARIVRILLQAGVDPMIRDWNDMTAIALAAWGEVHEVAKVLLEVPQTVDFGDKYKSNDYYRSKLTAMASGEPTASHPASHTERRSHLRAKMLAGTDAT